MGITNIIIKIRKQPVSKVEEVSMDIPFVVQS